MELSDELEDLFYDAIGTFPEEQREAAREWFAKAQAALEIIKDLQNGIMP
jgi:dsDNA-binding SOS-regulon protein